MARKVEVRLVDDLDGSTANETVSFAIDGTSYEIDLSGQNAGQLRDGLAKYIAVGRKTSRVTVRTTGSRSTAPPAPKPTADREQNQAIRDWAKARGLHVNDRGRIPADILAEYNAS